VGDSKHRWPSGSARTPPSSPQCSPPSVACANGRFVRFAQATPKNLAPPWPLLPMGNIPRNEAQAIQPNKDRGQQRGGPRNRQAGWGGVSL